MTATERAATTVAGDADGSGGSGRAPNRSAERAYRRREKRELRLTQDRLSRTGRPVRSALARVPFVIALIVVLGGGISGVLYLNTKSDESGLHAEQVQQAIADQKLQIEALNRSIADLDATPRIAQQAQALGMVPAGDAAILQVPASGAPTLIGTPSAVPTPPSLKAGGPGSTTAGASPTTRTTPAQPKTTPAAGTAVTTAASTTAGSQAPPPSTGKSSGPKTTSPKTTSPKTTGPKTTSPKTTGTTTARSTAATTTGTTSGGHR